MKYFAYGNNMKPGTLIERIGYIPEKAQCGFIQDYRLVFNKPCRGGFMCANILSVPGAKAWGVIYEMTEEDIEKIARYEVGYYQIGLIVQDAQGNNLGNAQVFIADLPDNQQKVDPRYIQNIKEGAEYHGLPEEYFEELNRIIEGRT